MAYSAFGRDIPRFLVLGYLPWVGLLPYLISRAMHAGVSRAKLHGIATTKLSQTIRAADRASAVAEAGYATSTI
jgi:hypothetical protein